MADAEANVDPQRLRDDQAVPSETTYSMWVHLGGLIAWIGAVASSGVAFFVPTLVVLVLWLARRHDSPFIDDHGREAVNFQISLVILGIVAVVLGIIFCGVGVLVTLPAVGLLSIIGSSLAAAAARRGEYFRYPACIRFLN